MTEFRSQRVEIAASSAIVFDFIGDFTNFQHIMPEQIKNWKSNQDSCSFTIDGLADLSMKIESKTRPENVHIVSHGKNPIDYTLDVILGHQDEAHCNATIVFNADLNPFIKVMASRPLQNFVDILAGKLQQHFSQ